MAQNLERLQQITTQLGDSLVQAIPTILYVLALLIIGWLVGKIIAGIVKQLLRAVNADVLSEKLKEVDLFRTLDFNISDALSKITFWLVFLVFLTIIAEFAGLDAIKNGIGALFAYLPKLFAAILFFMVGVFIANVIKNVVNATCESMGVSGARFISLFVFYFLVVIIAISALNQAAIDTSILTQNISIVIAAIFFAFAIGYGFASRDILSNILASFYSRDKFKVGQHISIESVEGTIIKVDSTSVTLENEDKHYIVPLSKLINTTVEIK